MMNTDDNPDLVPDDDPDDPQFIKAALLLQKIWDLNPDSRPVPKRNSPESLPAQGPAEHSATQKEDLTMLPAEERHQRKCLVCRHPDREEIEEEFIHWRDVWYLAKQYDIADPRSIDRHARVFGLVERRRENRRYMLDRVLESFPSKATAYSVIQALRAYSCLTDDNRWVEPPTRVEYAITTNRAPKPAPPLELDLEPAPPQRGHVVPTTSGPDLESAAADSEPPEENSEPLSTTPGPVPKTSGPTHSEPITIVGSATPPPNLPTWNGRFL
jgi:hypothetical protein